MHVRRAFAVATSGRPGPALIDVPEDIAHAEHEFDAADFWIDPKTTAVPGRRFRANARDGDEAVCLDCREGSSPIKVLTLHEGDRRPLGIGSLAMLARLHDGEV